MTIALSARSRFGGARFQITGELSRNSVLSQALDFPSDGSSFDLTGLTVKMTFRTEEGSSPDLTLSTADSTLTVSDADTLTILAPDLAALTRQSYVVDITSGTVAASYVHLAHGLVRVSDSPNAL